MQLNKADETKSKRVEEQFEALLHQLVAAKAVAPELAKSISSPTNAADIVPRFWELGVDDTVLAKVLAYSFKLPVFSGAVLDADSLVRSSSDPCPWLIADKVLYVTNPYDRDQIEPLMRRKKDRKDLVDFERLGVVSMSAFDNDAVSQANYDQGTSNEGAQTGAWAKEFVDELLTEAVNRKASDIHLNPESHGTVVRLRVDGRCEVLVSKQLQSTVGERYRLVANNLMERVGKQNSYLEPCSGYLVYQSAHRQVSMRLEMAPVKVFTNVLPKITIRILNNHRQLGRLDQLGLSSQQVKILRGLSRRANGLLIVTGPTGSGKSTTLKTLLRDIRDHFPEKAIYTIEDPVEDQLDGITSLEISKHMDFPKALKSLLRHDPDVLMVGEIRDRETADLAMRAAMTGHLVLTTLHTNDAHGAVNRLRDLGIDDALLAENLLAVTAQRLVSKVCASCSQLIHIQQHQDWSQRYRGVTALMDSHARVPVVVNTDGCERCSGGYRGRTLVNEIFFNDPVTEGMIAKGESAHLIRSTQQSAGRFMDVWDDGIRLVLAGVTTLDALEVKLNPLHVVRAHLGIHRSNERHYRVAPSKSEVSTTL